MGGGAGRGAGGVSARAAAATAFLASAGWGGADSAALAGDASPRRYWRLSGGPGGAGAVLMDADPAQGQEVGRFAAMTEWLRAQGFSAPEILALDAGAGLVLMEDLGDALFARVCARDAGLEHALYAAAVDALAALQSLTPPHRVSGWGCAHTPPPYDAATLAREARLAVEWWAPSAGAPLGEGAAAEYDALIAQATQNAAQDRRALVLVDYHAENLLWLPSRAGVARVGLLDYQDARIGSPAYDLVSLLGDARRDVGAAAAMRAAYAATQGADFDSEGFARDAAALSAQRCLKILGLFARLARRDGKPGHLAHLPRVWRVLAQDLRHPALAPLAAWVARWLPAPDAATLARVRSLAA